MEKFNKHRILRSMALFLLACIIMPLLVFGCAGGKSVENNDVSQRVDNVSMQRDSMDSNKEHVRTMGTYAHDSIYSHDSVVVIMKGDTVLRDRWHFRTKENTRVVYLTDTLAVEKNIYHFKTDTLKFYVNRTKYKEVEKKLTWWQVVKMKVGGFSIFAIIIFVGLYIIKRSSRKNKSR